jgi:peptidoglycan/LPS O-acetylase OafA/YrhL
MGESANLDLLRSAAVMFVVVFHLILFFSAKTVDAGGGSTVAGWGELGHWGVLMFFVHTSLVLMRSLDRLDARRRGGSLFAEFMVRRCFRLLPLSILTVVIVAALRLPVGHLRGGHFVAVATRPIDVLANVLLVTDLTHVDPVEAPLWSLPLEMQMYLLLPAIFWFVRPPRPVARILGLWLAAVLVAIVWAYRPVLQLPPYVPCFLAGVVAYRIGAGGVPAGRFNHLLWPVVVALLTAAYLLRPTLAVGWVACLALALAFPRLAELPEGLVRRACAVVARYSYGLYLAHFILIWLVFVRLDFLPQALQVAAFVALLALVPYAVHHLVEQPMIRLGASVADRWFASLRPSRTQFVVASAAALLVVVAIRRSASQPVPAPGAPAEGAMIGELTTKHAEAKTGR